MTIDPLLLVSLRSTFALVAYALAARWYVWPRISLLAPAAALVPLVWVHVFRSVGGSILAPGAVGPGVPARFREMVGYGDMITAALALVALIALAAKGDRAIWVVWVFVVVGLLDTANAVVQSMRYSVFDEPLGVNWAVVTAYVPGLIVSSVLIILEPIRARHAPSSTAGRLT